jgi:protein-disulfide isomerase
MRFAAMLALGLLAFAQTWETATELPAVNMTGMTPAQKQRLLRTLRTEGCTCGCGMKLAECRIKDPGCGDSTALSKMAGDAVKQGKTAVQVATLLHNSPIAKARADQNRILYDPVKLNIDGSPSKGPATAKVTLVEFSDFQCPYCSIAIQKAYALLQIYPKEVKLVFKQYPLDIHDQARLAAEASLAANAQGKFWELHDKMFANHRRLSRENIDLWARELGIDMIRFKQDVDSGKYRQQIDKDLNEGTQAGVQATPTFFINGQRYNGPFEIANLKPIIDAELKKKP